MAEIFEYHGFESIIDIVEDIEYCDEIPNGEWEGMVKVTIEYFPPDGEKEKN